MHVVGTAGHVDHGKSTLVEKLTGIDPDRFEEEKRRGLTIDLGFAWLALPSGTEVGIIDVPGHERFIKNMLAGAGGISICLFVVAANEGWMPQSAEHLSALEVLGISSGVVALTKADAVSDDDLERAREDVRAHLSLSGLRDAPIVACSALVGTGLDELVVELDGVVSSAPAAADVGQPRLWVDRVFTMTGAGTVVTGTLAGGGLATGDEVEIAPEGRRARIRSIQTHRRSVERAEPGSRVALNLAGLDRQGARRGDAVVRAGRSRPTQSMDARITILAPELSGHRHELSDRGAHLMYVGSAETPVRIKLLERDRLLPGDDGFAHLDLRDPLPLRRGDRFVLRDAGRVVTFGGGEVLDPLAPRARRRDPARLELLRVLASSSPDEALDALVEAEGSVDVTEGLFRSGLADVPAGAACLGSTLVARARMDELKQSARAVLAEYHEQHPLEGGMPREKLRARLELDAPAFGDLLESMEDVAERRSVVRLSSFAVALAPDQKRARDELLDVLATAGYSPPPARELGADGDLLRALVDAGDIVKIGDFYLTRALADEARARVRREIEASGPLTVAQIRDLLGTSRKYAVPLCEWLDATGATLRRVDVRLLGPTP